MRQKVLHLDEARHYHRLTLRELLKDGETSINIRSTRWGGRQTIKLVLKDPDARSFLVEAIVNWGDSDYNTNVDRTFNDLSGLVRYVWGRSVERQKSENKVYSHYGAMAKLRQHSDPYLR